MMSTELFMEHIMDQTMKWAVSVADVCSVNLAFKSMLFLQEKRNELPKNFLIN